MKKWKKIALWCSGILVVLIILGYIGLNLVTNYILRSISVDALMETGGALTLGSGSTALPAVSPTPSMSQNDEHSKVDVEPHGSAPVTSRTKTSTATSNSVSGKSDNNSEVGPPRQVSPSPTPYNGEITKEKAEKAQNEISTKEKALVASILLKKLSPSDISLFTSMMSGGMTLEEKKEAKKVVLQKLSEDEYNQLIAIAAKLGLSQGKDYQESQKEFTPEPSK
jgi:hypothetical protein